MEPIIHLTTKFINYIEKNKSFLYGFKAYDGHQFIFVWRNILVLGYLHVAAVYGLYLALAGYPKFYSYLWVIFISVFSSIAVTGGAHRLWSHKSYKANLPLRIFWATFMSMTFQNHIYEWCRDHRVHHKYSETDGDPHNAKRGFFFAHVGWLMVKKHRDVIEKGKNVDLSDLEQDGVVMFQKKFYPIIMPLMTFVMPMLVPYYCWGEDLGTSWYVNSVFRYIFAVNLTWCINSAAHIYGYKPYDKNIGPTENGPMMLLGLGEGFHNYHHTFPWDYKASEFGACSKNVTAHMIDFFAKIGWATELKEASPEIVRKRALRTGDGTWTDINEMKKNFVDRYAGEKEDVWGWDDKDLSKDEKEAVLNSNNNILTSKRM